MHVYLNLFVLLILSVFTNDSQAQVQLQGQVPVQSQISRQPAYPDFSKKLISSRLDSIHRRDQGLREQLAIMDQNWQDDYKITYDSLWALQNILDQRNMNQINDLQSRYGWDALLQLDAASKETIFLVIQHADSLNQARYLPFIYAGVKRGELPARYYALLKDRITLQRTSNQYQYYGTQCFWDNNKMKYVPFTIIGGLKAAERRRAALGLVTLESYLNFLNR